MNNNLNIPFKDIQKKNEEIVKLAGGRTCDWLPNLEFETIRPKDEIVARVGILNALLQIYFKAPIQVIKSWIERNDLGKYLTAQEITLLNKSNQELTEQELTNIYWGIEALWALVWVGGLIEKLPISEPVGDILTRMMPDLKQDESIEKLKNSMSIRPSEQIYEMVDLYYRTHWFTEDVRVNGGDTGKINKDIIIERRKSLQWTISPSLDWDNPDLNT